VKKLKKAFVIIKKLKLTFIGSIMTAIILLMAEMEPQTLSALLGLELDPKRIFSIAATVSFNFWIAGVPYLCWRNEQNIKPKHWVERLP